MGTPPVRGLAMCTEGKKDGLFLWSGAPHASIFTFSITQEHKETPPQSWGRNHTSMKTHHWSCSRQWKSAAGREGRDDSPQPGPFNTPPSLCCQLSTGYEPNPVPCSCGPKMPDGQNNAHRLDIAHSQCKCACRHTNSLNKASHAIIHKNTCHTIWLRDGSNYSGVLPLTFVPATPFYHLWAVWWEA